MSDVTYISYQNFIKEQYDEKLPLYKRVSETPPSFNKFKSQYTKYDGFRDWIARISGLKPTENQLYSIVSSFVKHGDRKLSELPALVCSLEKHQNIVIPVIYGVLTVEYWEKRLKRTTK